MPRSKPTTVLVVDTSVLVHAVNASSPEHAAARAAVEAWLRDGPRVAVTWPIVYEFLRVSTHPAVLPRPLTFAQAHSVVTALLAAPRVDVLHPGPEHESELARALADLPHLTGSRFHDLHTALLMREHGVRRIATYDSHFAEFAWIRSEQPARDKLK